MLRFDRSLLPPARLEFAVVADTHYMLDPGGAPLEFESRRRQSERARRAWEAVAALEPAFVVHMGDLVQEFPGRPGFERAQAEALAQIDAVGLRDRCRFVAGNHDVGDKPDPTMPTEDVTAAALDAWHGLFGPSWSAWDAGGLRFVILNTQILNTGLPAEARQRAWLEQQMAAADRPTAVFVHLPLYLTDPDEAALGHYDNVAEPARSWLLGQLDRPQVTALFGAHVHFRFLHALGPEGTGRYWMVPSTSFTRPGFGHLFTAAAAPEQGRDDVPKTGFLWARVVEREAGVGLDVHLVRTCQIDDDARGPSTVTVQLTPAPRSASGRVGATSAHVLAPRTRVPVAYPSAVRQPVRNDYPLLACLELGARRLRLPAEDLADAEAAARVDLLRQEGLAPQWTALGADAARRAAEELDRRPRIDDLLEVQLPGRVLPDEAERAVLGGGRRVLCPVLPGTVVPGKQHPRTRIGYRPQELVDLEGVVPAGVEAAVRLDGEDPWADVEALRQRPGGRGLCLLVELPGVDEGRGARAAAFAVVAAAALQAPVLLEPLVDLDRTMDVGHGLLDGLCNPRPAFHVARHLAALLGDRPCTPVVDEEGVDLGEGRRLVWPEETAGGAAWRRARRVCRLRDGSWWETLPPLDDGTGPLLLIGA